MARVERISESYILLRWPSFDVLAAMVEFMEPIAEADGKLLAVLQDQLNSIKDGYFFDRLAGQILSVKDANNPRVLLNYGIFSDQASLVGSTLEVDTVTFKTAEQLSYIAQGYHDQRVRSISSRG